MKSTLCTLLLERHPRELRLRGDDKWSELASGQKRNIDIQMLLLLYQEGKCRVSCPGCCIIGLEPLGTTPNQHHPIMIQIDRPWKVVAVICTRDDRPGVPHLPKLYELSFTQRSVVVVVINCTNCCCVERISIMFH